MRKLFMAALLMAFASPLAFAQTTGDDYNKYDIYAGFSHNRVQIGAGNEDPEFDDIFDEREGFNGFELAVKGNVSRYVGIKGDYSFHRRNTDFGDFDLEADIHNFLGGVEFKDNARETRVKPFAHILAGVAHGRVNIDDFDDPISESDTGFSAAIGGGLDFRVSDRVDFRAIQFDYNPNRANGTTAHNFRIGVGVVFR